MSLANVGEWQKNVDANVDLAPRINLQAIALSTEPGMAAFRFSDDVVSGASRVVTWPIQFPLSKNCRTRPSTSSTLCAHPRMTS